MRVHSRGLHHYRRSGFFAKLRAVVFRRDSKTTPDYPLLVSVTIVLCIGLIMLASATSILSFETTGGAEGSYFLKQQLLHGLLPGIIAFFIALRFPYERYKKFAFVFVVTSIVLPLLPFVPGFGMVDHNVRSWIRVGSLTIQTSEIAKATYILWLARWLSSHDARKSALKFLAPPLIMLGIIASILFVQPDTGTALVFIAVTFLMLFVSSARFIHVAAAGLLAALATLPIIFSATYKLKRILSFLHPNEDTLGVGYQIRQALIALGSGSWFGLGIGRSQQKFMFLPEVESDSIFAIIGEEWGFIASTFLICCFAYICLRALAIAGKSHDEYGKFAAVGIAALLGVQTVLNIGAMLGLIPLTGLPLPFISLGGTNLVILLALMGVLANISSRN